MRRGALLLLPFSLFVLSARVSADVLLVQAVNSRISGRSKSFERRILLKQNKMRIEVEGETQHTATLIDLNSNTITQIDFLKNTGVVYSIQVLHDYIAKSATGPITTKLGSEKQVRNVIGHKCDQHAFELAMPAYQDTKAMVIARGEACLSSGGPADPEYTSFIRRAIKRGVVVNYLGDNAILMALARNQTELYRLLASGGGIPLSLDLYTQFEGGLIGRMWNLAASHIAITTKSLSIESLSSAALDVPSSIVLKRKEH